MVILPYTSSVPTEMKGDGGTTAPKAAGAVDARFAAVHTDPRFQRFPRKQRHVEIDKRFAGSTGSPKKPSRLSPRGSVILVKDVD